MNKRLIQSFVILACTAACGTTPSPASPDASTPGTRPRDTLTGSRMTRPVETPGEPEAPTEDLPESEAAAGSVAEGTDTVGSCYVTTVEGLSARLCVDYNDGYTAESAGEHCREQGGTFNMGSGCDRQNNRLVTQCAITREMRARTAFVYRIPATRTMPDPPSLDADDAQRWCMAQMGDAPAMTTPENTGRCRYRTTENFLGVGAPGVNACVNYDRGFTEAQAQMECMGRTASTGSTTFDERSCPAVNATPGCRFTQGDRTWSVRYEWGYRSAAPWDNDMCMSDERGCFRRDCEAAGGSFFTGN